MMIMIIISYLARVASLLHVQANSASYPDWDGSS